MSSFSHWNSHDFQAFPAICDGINVGKLHCERSFTESSLRFGACWLQLGHVVSKQMSKNSFVEPINVLHIGKTHGYNLEKQTWNNMCNIKNNNNNNKNNNNNNNNNNI